MDDAAAVVCTRAGLLACPWFPFLDSPTKTEQVNYATGVRYETESCGYVAKGQECKVNCFGLTDLCTSKG